MKDFLIIAGIGLLMTFLASGDLFESVQVIIIVLLVIAAFIGAVSLFVFLRDAGNSAFKALPKTTQDRTGSIFSRVIFIVGPILLILLAVLIFSGGGDYGGATFERIMPPRY